MHYYLIIGFKLYCLYHVYNNRKPYYWFYVIFFLPIIGAVFYFITQILTSKDVDKIQDELTTIINPTKKIRDLEKRIQFSETYTNRINLADAYFDLGDFNKAVLNYDKSLEDELQDASHAKKQLIVCYYKLEDYNSLISIVKSIKNKRDFAGSTEQFYYGIALRKKGKLKEAEEHLKQIDRPYSNYSERLELAKFYIENDKEIEGKDLLNEIYEESHNMTKPNRRIHKSTIAEVERLVKTYN